MSRIPKRLLNRRSPPRVVSIAEGVGVSKSPPTRTPLKTHIQPKIKDKLTPLEPIYVSLSEVQRLPHEFSTDLPLSLVTSVDSIDNQESMLRTHVPRRKSNSIDSGKSRIKSASSRVKMEIKKGIKEGKGAQNLAQRKRAASMFQSDGTILSAGDVQIWNLSRKVRDVDRDEIRINIKGDQGIRITFHRGAGGIIQDMEMAPDSLPAEIIVPVGTSRFTLTGLGGKGNIPLGIEPGAAALTSIMSTRNRTFIGFQRNSLVHQIGTFRFLCRGVYIEADGTPSWNSYKNRNMYEALEVLSKIDHLKIYTTTHVRTLCIVTKTTDSSEQSLKLDLTGIRVDGNGTRIIRKDGVAHVWPISADAAYSGPAIIEIITDENTDVHDCILSTSAEQSVVEMLSSTTWSDIIEEGALSPHGFSHIRWIDESESSSLKHIENIVSPVQHSRNQTIAEQKTEIDIEEEPVPPSKPITLEHTQDITVKETQTGIVGINLPGVIAFENYNFDISQFAGDLDEEDQNKLVFTKISGPEWLSVESTGPLRGTPSNDDVGINTFIVRVTDPGGLFSDASVNIEVSFKELNRAPFWSPKVIKTENLDESSRSSVIDNQDLNKKSNSKSNSSRRRRRR
ncbi:MAG: putative Ig domain-containing protein [Candidatus Thermoplasmatota archaeon]|nr:putative Ig domain-containing protein [Candidatus Thermoplasmatota archaeon]